MAEEELTQTEVVQTQEPVTVEDLSAQLAGARAEVERWRGAAAESDAQSAFLQDEIEKVRREAEEVVGGVKAELAAALSRYRSALLTATPDIPEELVQGETVGELEATLEAARGLVGRVRQQLEARTAAERVPAGAPPRSGPDLSSLSPRDKIAYALARKGS